MIKDRRVTLPIGKIREESEDLRTFTFFTEIPAEAGQFIMLTDFKGGEKPFSISDKGKGYLSVTVKRLGEFTSRLFTLKEGDLVSIRGAYGSSFFVPGRDADLDINPEEFRPVLCGGGFGTPPLFFLARDLIDAGVKPCNIRVIAAGRTEEDLCFEEDFTSLGVQYIGVTEEETSGLFRYRGKAADALGQLFDGKYKKSNFLYASGSDHMMKSLLGRYPQELEYQFLFERYMKCAIGICGSCVVDPLGIRICKEGPALMKHQVEQIEEFGVYKRTATGRTETMNNRISEKTSDDKEAEPAGKDDKPEAKEHNILEHRQPA